MGARRVLPALDGLRAVAAGAVLLTHVAFRTGQTQAGAGGAVLARLDVGVAVFFVLSGFLLYPATRPVGRYALRRAARILPAYWVLLAVVAVIGSVPAAYWWLGQGYRTEPLAGALTQTWSLVPEVAFYAVLPGLVWLARRWEWPVLAGCVLVAYGWIAAVHLLDLPDRMLLWLPGHLDWFAVGMAVAAVARRGVPGWLRQLAAASGTCWAAAGALLFLLATPVAGPLTLAPVPGGAAVLKEAGYALVAALLLVPAALGPRAPVLGSPPLRLLGRWSYGIFLWHLVRARRGLPGHRLARLQRADGRGRRAHRGRRGRPRRTVLGAGRAARAAAGRPGRRQARRPGPRPGPRPGRRPARPAASSPPAPR